MKKVFPGAMQGRKKAREALFQRLEGIFDSLYDVFFQVYGEEKLAQEALERMLHRAIKRYRKEKYEDYLKLWAFRLAVESIESHYKRYLAELSREDEAPFSYLSLEEKLVVLLHDRVHLSYEECAAVLQISVGRVGRSLTYAREKIATTKFGSDWTKGESLLARVEFNRNLDKEKAHEGAKTLRPCTRYVDSVTKALALVRELPSKKFAEIEHSVRAQKFLSIFSQEERPRWQDLPWQYKLGIEAVALGVIGLVAVVVLPWSFSKINSNALLAGRFSEIFIVSEDMTQQKVEEVISADRLLASAAEAKELEETFSAEENDEFAAVDFPSGDSFEAGAAPLAPSRQNAAVYRLIVQSPNPKDLIPEIKSLFAEKKVKERDSSGREMPGGVYFDGITNVGSYPQILQAIEKYGKTKTYTNATSNRGPDERARLIVWIQQI